MKLAIINRAFLVLLILVLALTSGCEGFCNVHLSVWNRVTRQTLNAWSSKRLPNDRLEESSSTSTSTSPSPTILQGDGVPSSVGWRSGRLNRLTKWADNRKPNRPVISAYDPSGFWLWRRWKGTVLQANWKQVLMAMALGLGLHVFVLKRIVGLPTSLKDLSTTNSSPVWPWYGVPPLTDPLIMGLAGIKKAWEYHLTICSFILTFFTSQAFAHWQKVYSTTRMIQGRINDYCMLIVVAAQRSANNSNGSDSDTKVKKQINGDSSMEINQQRSYSAEGRELVNKCTRLIRMSHIFFWAQTPTSSNGLSDSERFIADAANCPLPLDDEHIGPLLLSPYGLQALVRSGQLTKDEARDLENSMLPPTQYAYSLLVWVGMYTMQGLNNGILAGGPGLESNLLNQLTSLRASMFDIDDLRAGRMPLAYVQLVQVLVDSLVALSPFALYPELGILSIPLVGLMALFFRGLMTLSKSFLDPFGVEGFQEQTIRVDVLVSELNFGAARRWIGAGAILP